MEYSFAPEQLALLERLSKFMREYNKSVNLTKITEPAEIHEKHFIDSVLPLVLFDVPRGTSVIDIGTGAGFPGAVWNICRPDLNITLLDSLRKRTNYLEILKRELTLTYNVKNSRSEELAHEELYREKFGIAISRAVANLPALLEYLLPFVKIGGYALAMKGTSSETEFAENAIVVLGGKLDDIISYELPSGDARTLVVIKKVSHTPTKYPRNRINIPKNPL